MKRLILIQNDYSGAGKTTLSRCLEHYLQSYQVPHHGVTLAEHADDTGHTIEASGLRLPVLISHLDRSNLVILDLETGFGELFNSFYKKHELDTILHELGFELTVLVPITSDRESFDGVTIAAEAFSDNAQYLVVHTPTSSFYDEDEKGWDRSYAARVMDMLDATDLNMPAAHDALELRVTIAHTQLCDSIADASIGGELQTEVSKWFRKVAAQLDAVRKYAFGDAFRPTITPGGDVRPIRRRRSKKERVAVAA